jgi:uncharacterized membrane protein
MSDVAAEAGRLTPRRAPRWIWVSLFLSLALNLLVIGIVCGTIWAVKRGGYWDAPTMIERNFRFMRFLPAEKRGQIRDVFKSHKPGLEPYWGEVRKARIRVSRMIAEGSQSSAEIERAIDDLFEKEVRARQAARPMISDMLAKLSPAEKLHFLRVFVPYLDEAQSSAEVKIAE